MKWVAQGHLADILLAPPYLGTGCSISIGHDVQGRAIHAAQALHHAVDAGDVVVGGAHKLEQTLHRVLPQHPGPCAAKPHSVPLLTDCEQPHRRCKTGEGAFKFDTVLHSCIC